MKICCVALFSGFAIQAGLLAGEANAQVILPQLVIVFDSPQSFAVPIPSWTVLALLALLSLCAFRAIRTRGLAKVHGRWVVAVVTAALLSLTFATADSVREARAQDDSPTLVLGRSPAAFTIPFDALFNMNQSGAGYGVAVVNRTGFPATIRDRYFTNNSPANPLLFYMPGPPPPGPECVVGYVLAPDATCLVFMQLSNHWN